MKIPSGEIRTILDQQYGIKMGKVQRVTSRISNHVLIVGSSSGKLVVRLPQGRKTDCAAIDFEAHVTQALIDSGLPVRRIVKTYDGQNYVLIAGGLTLTVFKFISGRFLPQVEPKHLTEAGRVLGKIHLTLANFEGQGQLIHGDFNPGNLVWLADKVSGILDLEHVRVGRVEEDLATLAAHYIFLLPEWSPALIIDAVLKGYGSTDRVKLRPEIMTVLKWLASWQNGEKGYFEKRLIDAAGLKW